LERAPRLRFERGFGLGEQRPLTGRGDRRAGVPRAEGGACVVQGLLDRGDGPGASVLRDEGAPRLGVEQAAHGRQLASGVAFGFSVAHRSIRSCSSLHDAGWRAGTRQPRAPAPPRRTRVWRHAPANSAPTPTAASPSATSTALTIARITM